MLRIKAFLCSGGRIRTYGLWVMSPTSYHCSTPQSGCKDNNYFIVGNFWGEFIFRKPTHRLSKGDNAAFFKINILYPVIYKIYDFFNGQLLI